MSFSATPTQLQQQTPFLPSNSNPPFSHNPNSNTFISSTSKHNTFSLKHFHKHLDPIVPWTSAIARHCKTGNLFQAIMEFTNMRLSGIEPNHITFITLLSGISHYPLKGHYLGSSIHAYARKLGLDRVNVMVGTAIVDMYSKCGLVEFARLSFDEIFEKNSVSWNTMIDGYMRNGKIDDALKVFDEMPERDTVSWTAVIGGFVKMGLDEEALEWFHEMQICGVEPDYVTIIGVLSACANLGALSLGLWINRFVMGKEFKDNIRVCNTLVDMYSRCGRVDLASEIFENMPNRSVVSWNSMIGGFAANGYVEEALKLFDRMQREGFRPDGVSFTGALTACSHAGFVDQGVEFFNDMQRIYNISPRIEHYGCLVDLYSRAGRIDDALNVMKTMPMKPNDVILASILAACRNCGDIDLAEMAMKDLIKLDPSSEFNYVMLANMYAAVGSWEDAGKVRRKMKTRGIEKKPGISSIEIEGGINEFMAGDKSHTETDYIYEILELLFYDLRIHGCVQDGSEPETSNIW